MATAVIPAAAQTIRPEHVIDSSDDVQRIWDDARTTFGRHERFLDAFEEDGEAGAFNEELDNYLRDIDYMIAAFEAAPYIDAPTQARVDEILDDLRDRRQDVAEYERAPGPAEYVRICDAFGAGYYYIPGQDTCITLSGRVSIGQRFSPPAETGVLNPFTPNEEAAHESDDYLTEWGFKGSLGFDAGGWRSTLSLGYASADGSGSTEIPFGQAYGWNYDYEAPNGSDGLNVGGTGGLIRSTTDAFAISVKWRMEREFSISDGWSRPAEPGSEEALLEELRERASRHAFGPSISYEHFEQDYWSHIQNLTFPGLSSERDQNLSENRFGAGFVVSGRHYVTPTFYVGGLVDLQAVYGHASLDFEQINLCNLMVCTPFENNFVATGEDSIGYFTYAANLEANAGVIISPGFSASLAATLDWLGEQGAIENKITGADPDTHVGTEDGSPNWTASVRIQRNF